MVSLFQLSLKFSGFPIKEAQSEFETILKIPEAQYHHYINEKKSDIVLFHQQNNPFYKAILQSKAIRTWQDIPILTKKDFQKPLAQRLSNGYTPKNVFINKTSGSSGDPFVFAKDKYCHALTWCGIIHRFGWYGIDFDQSFQARFYGIPLDFIGHTKERLKDVLSHRYRFPIFDMSDTILETILLKFQKNQFDYINGYTSSIVLFAKFLKAQNIILKDVCPTLKVTVTTSEMLFESDKLLLETQFGVPVVNEYGASELDLIAFQHPNGNWEVNSETILVEILDDHNKVLPNGQEGRIVITSLYNKAHPFIRYDIGDRGILDEKSTIKKPILKQLVGRTNDIAILPSGKKSPGLTFYYITKSIIDDDGNVKEFVIKQLQTAVFEIEYVSDSVLSSNQIERIEQAIEKYLEKGLSFKFIRKDKLIRSKSGKLKQFISLVS
ncbi:phenylacetate--CoA ligase family protein [Flavobacterium branchiophilum]|uniref:AMP-binding protein n=2 Tax=Flavobacterium branchiophilum TaxID=55197 RepID=A0A2H3KH80_9FLAO|nr:phenylacetate--CoA ligase family protein [Flavobacterium branchiophilum]PDS23395.1 AMP-binding protein [Flavobacterium branchiophilum]CCB70953.1 Putative capsular polysaccharide biosynthesis protein CapK [Flavobacterium branchiophilum FL-15]